MRNNRGRDANMRFLFGSVFFFFIVIMTMVLFTYFTLQHHWVKPKNRFDGYAITFSKQFDGLSYDLYLNDSLVYEGSPVDADTTISVKRFAEENALLVVERESEAVSIFQLGLRGKVLVCFGREGEVTVDVAEQ